MVLRSTMSFIILAAIIMSSCSKDDLLEDCRCTCHSRDNRIDGWNDDNSKDSTVISGEENVGGFEIVVDGWKNSETQDIRL